MGLLENWASRLSGPTGPASPPQRRSLTAAGARVNLKNPSLPHTKRPAWQSEAWSFRESVPEMRFAGDFVANTLGRLRVFAAENRPRGQEPVALEEASKRQQEANEVGVDQATIDAALVAVSRLNLSEHGSSLLGRFGENLEYAGECYLLGEQDDDHGETWTIRSVSEVMVTQGGARLTEPGTGMASRELNPATSDLLRLWTPHPRYHEWPDAAVASLLDVLEGMSLLGRRGRAHDRSRISAGQAFYLPQEFSLSRPGAAPVSDDLHGVNDDGSDDPFMEMMVDYMTAAISDESDASAVAPMIIRGPAMLGDRPAKEVLGTVSLHGEDPKDIDARYEALVMRFARGINLAPERVQGIGSSTTNWSAQAVTADEVKTSVEPRAERMCDALTAAYLRPALKAMGISAEQRRKVCLWFDPSELVQNPNRAEDAKAAHTAGALSDAALRRYLGFVDDDAPDNLELLRRSVDRERLSPASVPILTQILAGEMPSKDDIAEVLQSYNAGGSIRRIVQHPDNGVTGKQADGPAAPKAVTAPPPVGERTQPETASQAGGLGASAMSAAAKRPGPKDDPQGPGYAGLVVLDAGTGRALMLQRGLDDENDPAAGTWEFPGGGVEPGDTDSFTAAKREWAEEVGRPVPDGGVLLHTWTSADGVYQGHVLVVPDAENKVDLDGPRTVENADADYSEQAAWWALDDARKNPALRKECRRSPWKAMRKAADTMRSPGLVAALGAGLVDTPPPQPTARDHSGRFATREHARQWRLDRSGGRKLADLDRQLVDRLLAHADAAVGRAIEKAANRVRTSTQKDPDRSAWFPKGSDPRAVLADAGPERARWLTAPTDNNTLLDGAFDDLERLWFDEIARAADAVEDILATMTRGTVTASAMTAAGWGVADRIKANARPAWDWFKQRIKEHAGKVLHGDYTPSRDGESSASLVPAALVRGMVAMAGRVSASTESEAGGPGTGEVALSALRNVGAVTIAQEWQYPAVPRSHFPGHRALDGVVFDGPTDEQLAVRAGDEWIAGGHYYPQDHAGCLCWLAPIVVVGLSADADPHGDEVAELRSQALTAAGMCANPTCTGADPGTPCTCPCGGAGHGQRGGGGGRGDLFGRESSTSGQGTTENRPARGTGSDAAERDPVDPGGDPTRLDDKQLEQALSASLAAEDFDRFEALSNESDARDALRAEDLAAADREAKRLADQAANADANAERWARYEELTDAGMSDEEAAAEVFDIDVDQVRRDEAFAKLRGGGYTGGYDKMLRQAFEEYLEEEYIRAENATKGAMLNARARRIDVDPRSLLLGNERTARARASEELLEYWDANGRYTFDLWRDEFVNGTHEARRRFGPREDFRR